MRLSTLLESKRPAIPEQFTSEFEQVIDELGGASEIKPDAVFSSNTHQDLVASFDIPNIGGVHATLKVDNYRAVTLVISVTVPHNVDPEAFDHFKQDLKFRGIKLPDMQGVWYGDKTNSYIFKKHLGYVERPSAQPTTNKYDPRQAYNDRLTPAAQQRNARIAGLRDRDSFGGDSSNYR